MFLNLSFSITTLILLDFSCYFFKDTLLFHVVFKLLEIFFFKGQYKWGKMKICVMSRTNMHRIVQKIIHAYRQKAALKALLFSMAYTHLAVMMVRK